MLTRDPESEALEETGSTTQPGGERDGASVSWNLLHQSRAGVGDVDACGVTGPYIREGELAVVHFIIDWRKHCPLKEARWLVTPTGTDQLILILLAMAPGVLPAVVTSSDSWVQVTIKCIIRGRLDYLYVIRVFAAMHALRDGSESAWPSVEACPRMNAQQKMVWLFVLVPVLVLSGCDFLSAIGGMDFVKLCHFSLKAPRTKGLPQFLLCREGREVEDGQG